MSPTLNVGVDARSLVSPHTGVGRYTTNLVREFALQQSPQRIFLYSHRPFKLDFPLPQHWRVRTGAVYSGGLSTAFAQAFFPIWALRDGINAFWSPCHQLPILMPSRIRKVVTIHDCVWKRFPETMRRSAPVLEALLTPTSLRIADSVIADSQFTRSELQVLFPGVRSKINVIYLASSLKTDGPTGACRVPNPYFLFVGSTEPRKNLQRMLLAYVQYRKANHRPHDLVIVGADQWGGFSVIDFIKTNDLGSSVHVVKNADDTLLSALYANAQALVLVSLYEGFGLPLVEAMQWGTPLIASSTSSIVEVAGDAALLVDPNDTDGIAKAFGQMTEDEAMRLDLSIKSEARGKEFSWDKTASETMALIAGDLTVAE